MLCNILTISLSLVLGRSDAFYARALHCCVYGLNYPDFYPVANVGGTECSLHCILRLRDQSCQLSYRRQCMLMHSYLCLRDQYCRPSHRRQCMRVNCIICLPDQYCQPTIEGSVYLCALILICKIVLVGHSIESLICSVALIFVCVINNVSHSKEGILFVFHGKIMVNRAIIRSRLWACVRILVKTVVVYPLNCKGRSFVLTLW